MEIRIENNKFVYFPRTDGKYFVRNSYGKERPIPNFLETIKTAVSENEKYEVLIDSRYDDYSLTANLFDCEDCGDLDYVGYLKCNILTGEWEDGKSGGLSATDVQEIIDAQDEKKNH